MSRWALVALLVAVQACKTPPPNEGFTDLRIENPRSALADGPAGSKQAVWGSLSLTMLESKGVTLVTLRDLVVTLKPEQTAEGKSVCRATVAGTVVGSQWCTSPTYKEGLGQVLAVYFEKADHSLVLPWTAGAFKVGGAGSGAGLSFEKVLDAKALTAAEAEIVVQPGLWLKCP